MPDPLPEASPQPSRDLVARLRAAGCVFAEEEAAVLRSSATDSELEALVDRRVAGEPLEHVVGWAEFDGLRVALDPGVFIPRQRTVAIVEVAASLLAVGGGVAVDLCCGSGALGLALAHRIPGLVVHAVDSSEAAVACAARNLAQVGGSAMTGDLDAPLPVALRGAVDVILANVPYVPSAAVALMPAESRDHEPRSTVDGGADGLVVLRRVALLAPAWLRPGGSVLSEVSEAQAGSALAAFRSAGLEARVHHDAEREATVVVGTRPDLR